MKQPEIDLAYMCVKRALHERDLGDEVGRDSLHII